MTQQEYQQKKISAVKAWEEPVTIPTYPALAPDPNPMFLEKRVYQGSKGTVYPLPFTDRLSNEQVERSYKAVHLENEYLKVMVLPEIGGRIHIGLDKTNNYNFIYHNRVIKPALVGLTGPWISGGIEFNWPQHHRPTSFMGVDHYLEKNSDGSGTVWVGEVEPMNRMKGMAGITVHPGKSYIEAKVRLYNRTPYPQTFLWWANLGVQVNENYQAIFPPDVEFVADHARRAMSTFPVATGTYYGIDYAPGTDISWFKNIPVPSSYMALGSGYDFVGGYDHGRQAGIIHVADHHISPGKKLWTWGAGEFGARWYANLTDEDGPYVELMSGVYTDNQPDFSWLMPYETRTFSQFWYPIREIGYVKQANREAAISLERQNGHVHFGVNTTSRYEGARVLLEAGGKVHWQETLNLAPDQPFRTKVPISDTSGPFTLLLLTAGGREVIRYTEENRKNLPVPSPAVATKPAAEIKSNETLFLTGLHLEQYHHATFAPEVYYEEALQRDPTDARNNNALGLLQLRRGLFAKAEMHFRQAIETLTQKNPNPYDGEPYYNLGLALRFLGRDKEAYDAFYKATWSYLWQSAAFFALAQLACKAGREEEAQAHLGKALESNTLNQQALHLLLALLRRAGKGQEASALALATLEQDKLSFPLRYELYLTELAQGKSESAEQFRSELVTLMRQEASSYLDLALDYAEAGLWQEACGVLEELSGQIRQADPLIYYYLGYFNRRRGITEKAQACYRQAADISSDYCFPNRLEDIAVLQEAQELHPQDSKAPYYLGNLFYDKKRYREAIGQWEKSQTLNPAFSIVQRNLGLAYYNIETDPLKAQGAYRQAFKVNPQDARLLYELDQLEKRLGASPAERLERLERWQNLVEQRDDLYLEQITLRNQLGQYDRALELLERRHFHPWEGGEGKVPEQYVLAQLLRGQALLENGQPDAALAGFEAALQYPPNLGEGRHEVFTAEAPIYYHLGLAHLALDSEEKARENFRQAFNEHKPVLVNAYYQGLAAQALGLAEEARRSFEGLIATGQALLETPAKIDYFATSLPTFLIFEDDLGKRQACEGHYLIGLGYRGLGRAAKAIAEFKTVLELDPNHQYAQYMLEASAGRGTNASEHNP